MRNKFYINLFIIHINLFINPDYGHLATSTIGLVHDMYCVCKYIKQFTKTYMFHLIIYISYEREFIIIHLINTQTRQSNE